MRIAIPCEGKRVAAHFGHAAEFAIFDVDADAGTITNEEFVVPPPHEPGLLPKWLAERNVNMVLAGGMGQRARDLFDHNGIAVVAGVREDEPKRALEEYLSGALNTQDNPCDH